jgi:hypothetical protein
MDVTPDPFDYSAERLLRATPARAQWWLTGHGIPAFVLE